MLLKGCELHPELSSLSSRDAGSPGESEGGPAALDPEGSAGYSWEGTRVCTDLKNGFGCPGGVSEKAGGSVAVLVAHPPHSPCRALPWGHW